MWRIAELIFLIPLIGILSYFVHGFVAENLLTPNFVLVLFIVSVIAGVWALVTLLFYVSARHNAYFLAFVDLCIFAAMIAGVVELRAIGSASCSNFSITSGIGLQLGPFINNASGACHLLKASFAFGIIEIILFFATIVSLLRFKIVVNMLINILQWLALWVHHHHRGDDRGVRRETHSRRTTSHRSSGGSRAVSRSGDDRRRSGGGSRSRPPGSGRQAYV